MARISILGSGMVGTIVGKGFEKLGNEIKFYDINEKRVKELCNLGLDATTNLSYVVHGSDISFLCVPTPTKNRKIDLTHVRSVTENLARCLKEKHDYHVVVVKSNGCMIVFHDIAPHSDKRVGVPDFWREIKRSFRHVELVNSWKQGWAGLGILYKNIKQVNSK